jgi:hypothetical protein
MTHSAKRSAKSNAKPVHWSKSHRPPMLEPLEERTLFALAIQPHAISSPAVDLANALLLQNTGITITGATFVGADGQAGSYSGFDLTSGINRLAISDGVILTSGQAINALGPNQNRPDSQGAQDDASTDLGLPGDPDLDALTSAPTNDANSITITFTTSPETQSILFDFVFGSEEFPDFVGSINDAFGAYLDNGQVSFDVQGKPITVNNNFFKFNNSGLTAGGGLNSDPDVAGKTGVNFDIEYDGLTAVIRTQAPINTALATHTLKFTIADAFDDILDSGVFISRLQGSTQVVSGPTTDLPQPGVFNFLPPKISQNEAGSFVTLTVVRQGGLSGLVAVDLFTSDGTATAGLDYTAFPQTTLTFTDQQETQTITIPILDDAIAEGDEFFTATLANPTNAAGLGNDSVATVTIVDNELGVQFIKPVFDVQEGLDTVQLTVTAVLTAPAPTTLTVDYATVAGGSATPNVDYGTVSGTLTFAPGVTSQTFTIDIFDDYLIEPTPETINLALTNVSPPYILGSQDTAVVQIFDLVRPPAVLDAAFVTNDGLLNGVALRFSEAMTEETVEDTLNYDIFLRKETKRLGGSSTRTRVNVVSAVYEETSRTVTLTTDRPLSEGKVYEVIVNTTRFNGVESLSGLKLDGNYDNNVDTDPRDGIIDDFNTFADDFTGYLTRANKITYFDENGDKVNIQLQGDGKFELFRNVERAVRILRLLETSQDTILTGSVAPVKRSDNVAKIRTLLTGTGVRNKLPPSFVIRKTIAGLQEPNT